MKNNVTPHKSGGWKNRIIGEGVEHPEQLLANPKNWRIHPREQQAALTGMLEEVGWVQRVIVNKRTGFVVDGHMRVEVAITNGETEVPVLYVDLTEDEEAKVLATFDPISGMAAMDAEKFKELVSEIEFASKDAEKAIASAADGAGVEMGEPAAEADAEPQIDRAAELNKKWHVKTGDLWRIGEHRLLCGDSTKREDVQRVMGGETSPLLVTSPPYWVGKEYEREKTWEQVQEFIRACVVAWSPSLTHRAVINTGAPQAAHLTGLRAHIRLLLDDWAREFSDVGMLLRYARIWTKTGGLCHTRPESDCVDQHWEFIATFYHPETFEGQRRLGEPWATNGIWDDIPGTAQTEHSAPFHVELPSRNIRLHTDEGAIIFEPFCGSGTTMVACENLGRKCRGIEISPDYCAVILERMQTAFPKLKIERVKK